MNAEDLKELHEVLFYRGFGEKFNERVKAQFRAGKTEFTAEDITKIDGEDVGYRLHFKKDKDPAKDKGYFNSFDVLLLNVTDASGQPRQHNFSVDKKITAMEAYRMLKHGLLVAVNKTLFNKESQQYNTWLSIDVNGAKDQYGNYPVKSYHQNYYKKKPFVVKDELGKFSVPVRELESVQGIEKAEKALMKANLYPVTILWKGEEMTGSLAVNPQIGRIDLYNAGGELIDGFHNSSLVRCSSRRSDWQ